MEITGKIIWAGQQRGGITSQGKPWKSQDFVIENESNGPYGTIITKVMFTVASEDKLNAWNPQIGDVVTVGYSINAHEYNGKYYNDVKAFKYERKGQAQPVQQQYQQPAQQQGYQQQYQQPMPNQQYQQQTASANYGQAPYGTQAPY